MESSACLVVLASRRQTTLASLSQLSTAVLSDIYINKDTNNHDFVPPKTRIWLSKLALNVIWRQSEIQRTISYHKIEA